MTNHNVIDVALLASQCSVKTVEHHAVLDSTNTHAISRLDEGVQSPFVIVADEQTGGRGRSGNNWWSPRGALLFTLVVDRPDALDELPPYSLAVGLAVREALQSVSADVSIKVKWPNDVYLEDRKVCGILVEVPSNHRDRLVVGIGVNVNNSVMTAPDELRQRVVSMSDVHGHTFCLTNTLAKIVDTVVSAIEITDCDRLVDEWSQHCWLTGKQIEVTRPDSVDRGLCHGISNTGALLIQRDGEIQAISSGVVRPIDDART